MSKQRRQSVLYALLILILLGWVLWSWGRLSAAKHRALAAADDAARCETMAQDIKALRERPRLAGSQELEVTELTRHIERTAAACQIPSFSLVRISPEASRRLGGTPYREKPTQVLLRQVTFEQLFSFLHALEAQGHLRSKAIRLTAPREQETGDRWTAELTVTYLIYSPGSEPAVAKGGF